MTQENTGTVIITLNWVILTERHVSNTVFIISNTTKSLMLRKKDKKETHVKKRKSQVQW